MAAPMIATARLCASSLAHWTAAPSSREMLLGPCSTSCAWRLSPLTFAHNDIQTPPIVHAAGRLDAIQSPALRAPFTSAAVGRVQDEGAVLSGARKRARNTKKYKPPPFTYPPKKPFGPVLRFGIRRWEVEPEMGELPPAPGLKGEPRPFRSRKWR
eukprot:TRINITY_DN63181_c0_g1_i1.p1 TRINITY_DN63181_c0_g1~~TRINITY_DN63181_c0_g1_i1.p1  ORF type:complete len:175 (+),score=10.05 TRINITY_DN63181_c0_g1_i1:58-525(+)